MFTTMKSYQARLRKLSRVATSAFKCDVTLRRWHQILTSPKLLAQKGDFSVNLSISSELFIRWMQLNTFLPSMQFSISPWQYEVFYWTKSSSHVYIISRMIIMKRWQFHQSLWKYLKNTYRQLWKSLLKNVHNEAVTLLVRHWSIFYARDRILYWSWNSSFQFALCTIWIRQIKKLIQSMISFYLEATTWWRQ